MFQTHPSARDEDKAARPSSESLMCGTLRFAYVSAADSPVPY